MYLFSEMDLKEGFAMGIFALSSSARVAEDFRMSQGNVNRGNGERASPRTKGKAITVTADH